MHIKCSLKVVKESGNIFLFAISIEDDMEKKGKSIETTVNLLPEPIIQHIQSFLNAKEAARTTLLSKPWYTAWLTRPTLDFDERDFKNLPPESSNFEEFTTKTMQRYRDLNLKIDSFRLRIHSFYAVSDDYKLLAHNLILNAIKIGANDLKLNLHSFVYPRELLESESIIRLSLAWGKIDGNCVTFCSRLKSLSIDSVHMMSDDAFWNIITSCSASIEELSLSNLWIEFMFSQVNPYELHKLKRLFLDDVLVDNTFFSDFASKLPCLKDLSLVRCSGYTRIEMVSSSLECIRLVQHQKLNSRLMDKFDVPNIRKFTYLGFGVPSLNINKGRSSTREWEFDISIRCYRFPAASWFLSMKRLLKKMRLSRITISLAFYSYKRRIKHTAVDNNFGVVPKRVAVESLTIEKPSKFCFESLLPLLGICCPKFITHYWLPETSSTSFTDWKVNNESLGILFNELSANQDTLGLNEVKVEIDEEINNKDEWRPLVLEGPLDASKPPVHKCKVRFRLTWG